LSGVSGHVLTVNSIWPFEPKNRVLAMNRDLQPIPSRKWRLTVLMALWALALVGTTSWPARLGFVVSTAAVFGTWRRFRVSPKSLKQRWTVAFFDLPHQQWKLGRFTRLEVDYERQTGWTEFLLFGPMAFVYGFVIDRFFPWIGGTYQIWLNDETDRRVLAWQGNSQTLYEQNVDILKEISGLPITMR
jgi:hypothetical protein